MVDVRMNYSSMEKMEQEFNGAAKQLDESMREMKKIAKTMEDGALHGMGGDAFRDAIMQKLLPRMQKLEEKMIELSSDIDGAVRATRDGVKTAKSRFK
jgi:uncharacterized protein YukE